MSVLMAAILFGIALFFAIAAHFILSPLPDKHFYTSGNPNRETH
jgi:hypothetical protein